MGVKLADYYKRVQTEFGSVGRVKLAMLTKLWSERAMSAEDSAENIKLFDGALAKVREAQVT